MMKAQILTAMIAAGASQADTVQPSSTTATYGDRKSVV